MVTTEALKVMCEVARGQFVTKGLGLLPNWKKPCFMLTH